MSRAVTVLHLDAAASWLRGVALRTARTLVAVAPRLGTSGLLAGATALVTSPTGRSRLGNQAADKLFAGVVCLGGKLAGLAAPVVHRIARLSDPQTPQAHVMSALCRSYLLHRLLRGFVGNVWLRLLVEAVLVPAVINSRLAVWARGVLSPASTAQV